jgi:hypothetical protein
MSATYIAVARTSPLRPKRHTAPAATPPASGSPPMLAGPSSPPKRPQAQPAQSVPNQTYTSSGAPSTPPPSAPASIERVRPLPRVPPTRPHSDTIVPTYVRPLPRTPQTPSSSPTPPTTPSSSIEVHSVPSSPELPRPPCRPNLQRLQVPPNPHASGGDAPETALSPLSFLPPSPATRHKRTVDKLARQFGESIPHELLSRAPALIEDDEEIGELVFATPSAVEAEFTDDEDDAYYGRRNSLWRDPSRKVAGQLASQDRGLFNRPITRESRHWYHEQRGKLVEQDPRDIIQSLRTMW